MIGAREIPVRPGRGELAGRGELSRRSWDPAPEGAGRERPLRITGSRLRTAALKEEQASPRLLWWAHSGPAPAAPARLLRGHSESRGFCSSSTPAAPAGLGCAVIQCSGRRLSQ